MEIKDIKKWFEIAKPNPTIEDACVQIGCHYEEMAEMAGALHDADLEDEANRVAGEYKGKVRYYIDTLDNPPRHLKIELLDALCDQIVTAVGAAHMLGMDIEGALNEVNKSNHSKFEGGKAVLDENGKIKKGKDYFAPDLKGFIK